MNIDKKLLKSAFHAPGWSELPLEPETERLGFCGIYASPYAVVAFVCANSASDVTARWPDCQVQMGELRPEKSALNQKDMYLVFLVSRVEPEAEAELLRVLSDTNVCRKLCIELEGRSLEEAVKDLSFVSAATRGDQDRKANVVPLLEALDLPKELKDDLGKSSPAKILENYLAGKYKRTERRK